MAEIPVLLGGVGNPALQEGTRPGLLSGPSEFSKLKWALAAYLGTLIALTWARPLWLDEILTLLISRENGFVHRMIVTHLAPGAVPLGFEVQRLFVQAFGFSRFSVRLPSELCSVLALAGMLLLAREIGTRGVAFVGVVWAVLPMFLRYAVEARPYSQALFLSVASTALLFRMMREPRTAWVVLYGTSVLAGIYTQPYSLFLQGGLLAPLLFEWRDASARRTLLIAAACLLAGVLLFAPWVLWSAHAWSSYTQGMDRSASLPEKLPLVLLREFAGGGYVCSLSFLIFAAVGCLSTRVTGLVKAQLVGGVASCIVLALAGDVAFHYFYAARQVMFALIPLTLLAGEGWAEAWSRWGPYPRVVLLITLLASSVIKDHGYFVDASENWREAAERLEQAAQAGCVWFLPRDGSGNYDLFEPNLPMRSCGGQPKTGLVLVPISKYSTPDDVRAAAEALKSQGFRPKKKDRVNGVLEIQMYQREDPSPGTSGTVVPHTQPPYNQ